MYIILAILLFGVLIAAHEWGHFMAARISGVTVHEFAIGMGPVLWKRKGKKDTVFSVRAFPIGGFCALEGEEEESDDPHSLVNQGFWKKVLVFAAGPIMNFLAGALILLILNSQAAGFTVPVIAGTAPEFETVNNGMSLKEGDVFWSINGSRVYLTSDVDLLLMLANKEPIDLVVLRDGEKVELKNLSVADYTDSEGNSYHGYGLYRSVTVQPATLGMKLKYTWYNSIDFVRTVWYSLQMLVTGSAGVTDLSGPVGIVSTINDVGNQSENLKAALENIAYFGAMISVNLAVMNLLPIPALDGGHILFLIISTLSEKVFKRKVPMKYEAVINMVFFALLMGLMLLVTFNDVRKLISQVVQS